MPAVPSWDAPTQFDLTNPYSGTLSFNVQTASGLYLLVNDGCDFQESVRSTVDNVPQADGAILHPRFLTGTQMPLKIGLWQDADTIACDDLLVEMLDTLSGAFRSLLNAGDNEGRLAWEIAGGNERMLDDVRLLVYPSFQPGPPPTFTVTIDSGYPYAQDLNQTRTPCADGATATINNTGSADYMPVFQVNRLNGAPAGAAPVSAFTIDNLTTGEQFVYDDSLPGAAAIAANRYAEITTFANTVYQSTTAIGPGDGRNLKAGVDELNSEYFALRIGSNDIEITGCDMDILWAPAWG